MSQSRIQVGDLVMVVKPERACACWIGRTFYVSGIQTAGGPLNIFECFCADCNIVTAEYGELVAATGPDGYLHRLDSLQKIDPLTEPTAIPTTEGIEV